MPHDPARRSLLLAAASITVLAPAGNALAAALLATDPERRLRELENRHGGRLGVSILDTGSGKGVGHRADERFPMCSTFKFLGAALVLSRVDRGEEQLDRRIAFSKEDLVSHSPVTEKNIDTGMTVGQLCHATVTVSDNTAANLLLASFGGPAGLTAFARSIGDQHTQLDRWETELNQAIPGDPRDTTTPAAMAEDMRLLLLGDTLSPVSRKQLIDWLVATTTGHMRIRGGLPKGWRAGDKTGTSDNGVTNDIAIVWPPGRAPLLVAAYYAEYPQPREARNAVIAEVGRIAASL